MHHAHQTSDHITHRVALADDETIQAPPASKGGVEVARLGHAVGAHERLANHENLVRLCQLGEFFQRRHEPGIVVAAAGGVDEHDVKVLRGGIRDGIFGDVGGVFAVAFLEELDTASAFARGEFLEVAGVHTQLFHGAGAEGVAGGDENFEVVLEKEEGEFGKVGRFAHAVDADDGDDVGAARRRERVEGRGGGDGRDRAEQVEGASWGENFAERGFH